MTKRKTRAAELAKTSGQAGEPPGALPAGYTTLLTDLKTRVRAAQLRAVVSVNWPLTLTSAYGQRLVGRLRRLH
jgi:hypothetical protein